MWYFALEQICVFLWSFSSFLPFIPYHHHHRSFYAKKTEKILINWNYFISFPIKTEYFFLSFLCSWRTVINRGIDEFLGYQLIISFFFGWERSERKKQKSHKIHALLAYRNILDLIFWLSYKFNDIKRILDLKSFFFF